MGKVKLFPTAEYTSKQPRDPIVPRVPCTGIFLGPSKSGKTVALISAILDQYLTAGGESVFERIYIFSPSIEIDDAWKPVKEFIERRMGVNTEREQVYFDKWDEGALRGIIEQQKKITRKTKELGFKKLYEILVVIDDFADQPELHRRTGDGALDTLFIRGRHMQISTWVSSQKLRLISAAVRVNMQFMCVWRLRNQLELEAVLEELTALLPKQELQAIYQEATREPYSFLFIHYLKPRAEMFYKRWEETLRDRKWGRSYRKWWARLLGSGPVCDSECHHVAVLHQLAGGRGPHGGCPTRSGPRQISDSTASDKSTGRSFWRRKKRMSTTIYVDSRKRTAGDDSSFEFDIGETLHLQTGARLSVLKFRVADAFLSTDRGFYMYWIDEALQTLNWAVLPVGAYTGARLAAWISSNYGSATYVEQTNEIGVAYDGNRRILNDYEIRSLFPSSGSYPAGATPSRPLSINHLLGPSFIEGALQIFTFVTMNPYSELFLRCSTLATAADIKGPLGQDIIAKMIIDKGIGNIMQTRTDEGHFVKLHGPITLRTLRFKLTDVDGNVVNTRGTSVSFVIFLNYDD